MDKKRKPLEMKTYAWAVLALLCLYGVPTPCHAQATPLAPAPPVSFMASAASAIVQAGEPVTLTLTLTNQSDKQVTLLEKASSGVQSDYDYDVTWWGPQKPGEIGPYSRMTGAADMDNVSLTAYGHETLAPPPVNAPVSRPSEAVPILLAPGQGYTSHVVVSRLFDMSRSGTYSIGVRRRSIFLNVSTISMRSLHLRTLDLTVYVAEPATPDGEIQKH